MAEWKPFPGFEAHYMISDEGQVMRIAPHRGAPRPGKILKPRLDGRRYYLSVMLCSGGKTKVVSLHRAVLQAFRGDPPFPDAEGNHEDGNKLNCRLDNLTWTTPSQNKIHAFKTGLRRRKLTDEQMDELKARYTAGVSQTQLAIDYGVSQRFVSSLVRGKACTFRIKDN